MKFRFEKKQDRALEAGELAQAMKRRVARCAVEAAVISVVKEINEPRYPSFMGIRKANRATIPVWTNADLNVDAGGSKVDC